MELLIIELNSLEYVKLDITSLNVDCLYWNNEEFKDIWIDLIADDLSVEELHDSECEEDDDLNLQILNILKLKLKDNA